MIVETKTSSHEKAFIDLPRKLYKQDPSWVCTLDSDIRSIFDPRKNTFFHHGDCKRWIAIDTKGETIGRIAAFINYQKTKGYPDPAGGIGFFECVKDDEIARQLFQAAGEWLRANGMKAMDGPINFGENDRFWGLLVEGFQSPSYGMNYNPPYYIDFFESFGFQKLYDQYTNVLKVDKPMPERFTRISDWVMKKEEYRFECFSPSRKEKSFRDFQEVYNDAWNGFDNFVPIELETIRESFRQMEPIMDERIIWFAYHNDQPIAFILCLPDVNQLLKPLRGKMHSLNKLRFVWYRKRNTIERIRIIVMGCKQKFQNRGIESALIRCLQNEVLPRHTVKEVELAWVGEFNKKMMALHEATGAVRSKVHRTYRFYFEKSNEAPS
ncbi:MAG TPA: GNAT family N-acetyltransferase [Flavisolibacter sp.]